jgi:hypothetical protein
VKRRTDDPHRRFRDWLLAGADEDLPRDVAVHAYVCADCQLSTAALDMLYATDLPLAGPPPLRAAAPAVRHPMRRVALATGGAVAVTAVAVVATGALRLPTGILLGGGSASPSGPRTQEVLGNTGEPEASPTSGDPTPPSSSQPSRRPATPGASVPPGTQAPTFIPIVTPVATQTARPSVSGPPRPTPATPAPTASPTVAPTPTPPEPTPEPTVTETPSPLP